MERTARTGASRSLELRTISGEVEPAAPGAAGAGWNVPLRATRSTSLDLSRRTVPAQRADRGEHEDLMCERRRMPEEDSRPSLRSNRR